MRLYLPEPSVQVTTGNFATVNDAVLTGVADYENTGGARAPLGVIVDSLDSSNRILMYKYVQLTSTAVPTLIVGPVYYTTNTFTIVTPVSTEGGFGVNGIAGILLNASATYNNYVWIQVYGYLASIVVAASTAIGDSLIGTAGNQLTARVAANTAPTNTVVAMALTAVSSTKSDVLVVSHLGGIA